MTNVDRLWIWCVCMAIFNSIDGSHAWASVMIILALINFGVSYVGHWNDDKPSEEIR
jgi:hypothetical protein